MSDQEWPDDFAEALAARLAIEMMPPIPKPRWWQIWRLWRWWKYHALVRA